MLRVARFAVRFSGCGYRGARYVLRVTSFGLRTENYAALLSTSQPLYSLIYDLKFIQQSELYTIAPLSSQDQGGVYRSGKSRQCSMTKIFTTVASHRKPGPTSENTIWNTNRRTISLEFTIWVIGAYLQFGFWCLKFSQLHRSNYCV